MDFDKPKILKCPHCGGLRRVCALLSGNDIGMTIWSDQKVDLPSLPSISPILRCPVCKKYHFYHRSQIVGECRTHYNDDFGYLSYESLNEALVELDPKGEEEKKLRMMLLWAYNDKYGLMHNVEILPAELESERKFFRENAIALFRLKPNDYLLHAELFREMGEFENCLAALERIGDNELSTDVATLKEKAQNKDSNVFIVESDKWSDTERFPTKDDKGCIYSSRKDWDWEYIKECIDKVISEIRLRFGWYDACDDEY